jgi:hypothetical protein
MNSKPPTIANDLPLRNGKSSLTPRTESEALHHYLQAATSDNTRKAYRSAIRLFEK